MKPFNLDAAKAGAPIVCRDGTPAKFLMHVMEASPGRVIALIEGTAWSMYETGTVYCATSREPPHAHDLFMAPVKRTVWINVYPNQIVVGHPTQAHADECHEPNRIGGKAWPLEIEE